MSGVVRIRATVTDVIGDGIDYTKEFDIAVEAAKPLSPEFKISYKIVGTTQAGNFFDYKSGRV